MMLALRLSLLISLLCLSCVLHAQISCPPGMMPYSTAQDVSACGPIPGNNQMQPQAPLTRWESRWGAIATDPKAGSVGVSTGMQTKEAAEQAAVFDCESKKKSLCKIALAYDNECAAMIAGNTGYNVDADSTIEKAVQSGMKTCVQSGDSNCHVFYSACSSPQRVQ